MSEPKTPAGPSTADAAASAPPDGGGESQPVETTPSDPTPTPPPAAKPDAGVDGADNRQPSADFDEDDGFNPDKVIEAIEDGTLGEEIEPPEYQYQGKEEPVAPSQPVVADEDEVIEVPLPPPDETPPATPPAEPSASEGQPPSDATPEPAPAPAEPGKPEASKEEEDALKRQRVVPKDQEDAVALRLYRQSKGELSLEEAAQQAREVLGIEDASSAAPETPAAADTAPVVPELDLPEGITSLADVDARVAETQTAMQDALDDLDGDRAKELSAEMIRLQNLKPQIMERDQAQAAVTAQQEQQAMDQAWDKTAIDYPEMQDANSEFRKAVIALDQQAQDLGLPVASNPNRAAVFAAQVAQAQGVLPASISPRTPAAPAPTPPAAPPATSPPNPPLPASARPAAPPTPATDEPAGPAPAPGGAAVRTGAGMTEAEMDAIFSNPDSVEAFADSL